MTRFHAFILFTVLAITTNPSWATGVSPNKAPLATQHIDPVVERTGFNPKASFKFIPKGYSIQKWFDIIDFTAEGSKISVLVLKQDNDTDKKLPRKAVIARQEEGFMIAMGENDKIIPCESCFSSMGDPFLGIDSVKKGIVFSFEMGWGQKRGTEYTFKYSRIDKAWQLTGAEESYGHANKVLTPKKFGKINFDSFNPDVLWK